MFSLSLSLYLSKMLSLRNKHENIIYKINCSQKILIERLRIFQISSWLQLKRCDAFCDAHDWNTVTVAKSLQKQFSRFGYIYSPNAHTFGGRCAWWTTYHRYRHHSLFLWKIVLQMWITIEIAHCYNALSKDFLRYFFFLIFFRCIFLMQS